MHLTKRLVLLFMTGYLFGTQPFFDDPVVKIRMQRAAIQGINEADLPPVPRGVMEPPALPAPEIHVKDFLRPPAVVKHNNVIVKKMCVKTIVKDASRHPINMSREPALTHSLKKTRVVARLTSKRLTKQPLVLQQVTTRSLVKPIVVVSRKAKKIARK